MSVLGAYNQNNKFIPSKDYVSLLASMCKEGEIVSYTFKKLPKSKSCSCTVTITRRNSVGKPKQESSDVVSSEREAQCIAANQMILRLEKSAKTKPVAAVEFAQNATAKTAPVATAVESEKDEENLTFDYSADFKPQKIVAKKDEKQKLTPLEHADDFQPFDQFSIVSLPIRENPHEYWFSFLFNSDPGQCCGICQVKVAGSIRALFGDCLGKFTFTNVARTKNSVVGTIHLKQKYILVIKLAEPHDGYVTLEFSDINGQWFDFKTDDNVAMTFE